MQNLQKLIDKALDDPDGTEVYDENAIKKAVKAVQDADTEKVAEYLMDSVLKLAEVYQQVWENNGREIGEDVETVGIARELEPVDAKGMILSIYPSLKVASPSNAVLVIKGEEDAAVLSETELSNATPSNATPSNAVAKTAVFSTETLEKIGDKPIVKDSLCEYVLSLVREYNEDQDSRNLLPLKTPIKAEISVPDQLDSEKPILAAVADAEGTQHPLEVTVNEDGKMQAIATLQNMIINLGKEYYANVLTIANGTTLSTKVEMATQGMGGETLEVEVPENISFELIQCFKDNILIGIKLDKDGDYLYVATMHEVQ